MNPLVYLVVMLISLFDWVLLIYIVMSWLIGFGILNQYQPVVRKVYKVLGQLVEPALSRIRRYLPDFGGIDLSPVVLLLALYFLRYCIIYYLG